jgi:hypothetical protein
MMGKKMALLLLELFWEAGGVSVPEAEEEDSEEDGQYPYTDGLGLLEDLDQAICEGSNPEKPFEKGSKHDTADDGDVDNLRTLDGVLSTRQREKNLHP